MKVTWRRLGSDMSGKGFLAQPIEKGKKLLIYDIDDGIATSIIQDIMYDDKNSMCLVYTNNNVYEVYFEQN